MDFLYEINEQIIEKNYVLKKQFSEEILQNAAVLLKELILAPDEIIF